MTDYWAAWRPGDGHYQPIEAVADHLPFPASSPLLSLPCAPAEAIRLPCFGSACSDHEGALDPGHPLPSPSAAEDLALYAGGPISALAWCPAALPVGGRHVLALACHSPSDPVHVIGHALQGPSAIQLWTLPPGLSTGVERDAVDPGPPAPALLPPRLALVLPHDGGVTWGMAWCPDPAACNAGDTRGPARLGLLAACLGSGAVEVHAVPMPPNADQSESAPAVTHTTTLVARLTCPPASCVAWAPTPPHDTLLLSCWDGCVLLLKLQPGDTSGKHPGIALLARIPVSPLPLRGVAWVPPPIDDVAGAGSTARHLFAAVGQEGCVAVWDARDALAPQYTQQVSTACLQGVAWTTRPQGVLATGDDGALRGVLADAEAMERNAAGNAGKIINCFSWRGEGQGALWAVSVEAALQLVAYGGEDGVVGVAAAGYQQDNRKRPPHSAVSAFRLSDGVLRLLTAHQLGADHGLFTGKAVERLPALRGRHLSPEQQCVTRLAWHPSPGGEGAGRLAAGCTAGIVRVQTIYRR